MPPSTSTSANGISAQNLNNPLSESVLVDMQKWTSSDEAKSN